MKKFVLTAGAACAIAALYALPSLAAGASATDSATGAVSNATTATGGTNGASASTNANAAGTNAGTSGSASNPMSISDIDVKSPFGSTTVNDQQTPEAVSANLTAAQRTDLQARCNLINTNASMFAADVPAFCQSYLEYAKAHPAQ